MSSINRVTKIIFKVLIFFLITELAFNGNFAFAKKKKSKKGVPTREVSVKSVDRFILFYNQAIQGMCTSGKDVYIQQAYRNNEFEEFKKYKRGNSDNLILISRCRYSKEFDAYLPKDHMLLKNVGHGQTIDSYRHKGKRYLLISCGKYKPYGNKFHWSTQIGRIIYKPNKCLDNSKIKRLTYLKYANRKCKALCRTQVRIDGSVSPDKKVLLIWKTNGLKNELTGYDFKTVNKLWDKAKGSELKVKGNKKLKKAIKFCVKGLKPRPKSIQGLALSNKKRGRYTLYISSGDERYYKFGNTIYKYEIKGKKIKFKSSVKLITPDIESMFDEDEDYEAEFNDEFDDEFDEDYGVFAEIESLEILKGKLRFIMRNTENFDQQIIGEIPIGRI